MKPLDSGHQNEWICTWSSFVVGSSSGFYILLLCKQPVIHNKVLYWHIVVWFTFRIQRFLFKEETGKAKYKSPSTLLEKNPWRKEYFFLKVQNVHKDI